MGKTWLNGLLVLVVLWVCPAWAELDISPSFLGMYRKTMEIEDEFLRHARNYGVDPRTARAVLIQESGGNSNLTSSAGAQGYFQVMPATFRMLRVPTNIEAGIKYLAQMHARFGREDYAIAAYNAGPGSVGGNRPLPLETLQYVIGVGSYKSVLRLHETEIRRQIENIRLKRVYHGESWERVAQATGVPVPLLRLYNPFLARRSLKEGYLVAYPVSIPAGLLDFDGQDVYYTSRVGDSYLNLALIFGTDFETFRNDNDLWRLQQLPVGMRLRATLPRESPFRRLQVTTQPTAKPVPAIARREMTPPLAQVAPATQVVAARPAPPEPVRHVVKRQETPRPRVVESARSHTVRRGDNLIKVARRYGTTVSALQAANGLRNSDIKVGDKLAIPGAGTQYARPHTHRVKHGENLTEIARQYGTNVRALMRANKLRNSRIHPGAKLKVPGPAASARPRAHRIRQGETLTHIAERYGTSVRVLMRTNGLHNARIQAGTTLRLP